MMRLRRHRWLGWIPPLVWMGLIFLGSTDLLAASHTSRFIEPLLRWLSWGWLRPTEIVQIHFFIRKTGHVCEYAILAALTWYAVRGSSRPITPDLPARSERFFFCWALVVASLYAAGDEFHQSFVPTRTASVHDVMIDTAGAFGGLLALGTVRRVRRRWAAGRRRPDRS